VFELVEEGAVSEVVSWSGATDHGPGDLGDWTIGVNR
jgi:hypothetical protein